jgi:hypothetical protein
MRFAARTDEDRSTGQAGDQDGMDAPVPSRVVGRVMLRPASRDDVTLASLDEPDKRIGALQYGNFYNKSIG